MPLLPAHLAVPATTLLLILLAASASAASFTCTGPSTCKSTMGYIVPIETTYADLLSRFNTSTIQDLLDANSLTSNTTPQETIPAGTTVTIPFSCLCAGSGVGQSDKKPIYTVQDGDTLADIANSKFGRFVTFQEIADANGLPNANDIKPTQSLWIPLPCSCDKFNGSEVTHFAYSVGNGETPSVIATKFGVALSTLLAVNKIAASTSLTEGQILDVPLRLGTETGAPGTPTKPPGANTPEAQPATPGEVANGKGLSGPLMIGGAFLLLLILVIVIWFITACFKHVHQGDSFVEGAKDLARRFQYHELVVATNRFSKKLGQGAFGVVYQGELTDKDGKQQVAVKKLKKSNGDINDFHAEIMTISETRHRNLVRLKGWCSRNRSNLIDFMCWWRQKQSVELFLVYELVPNGNLDAYLKNQKQVLTWETRYNIVRGIGAALRYLHYECVKCILHRDIKPSNILLDGEFNAILADFGLSRIANKKNKAVRTLGRDSRSTAEVQERAIGTKAYMDPNCIRDGIVNFRRRSDVYSFGILLLEIACTGKTRANVWDLYERNQENMAEAADARLGGNFEVAQMQRVAVLGLWCSLLDGRHRPSMLQAMEVLEHEATLPNLMSFSTQYVCGWGAPSAPPVGLFCSVAIMYLFFWVLSLLNYICM